MITLIKIFIQETAERTLIAVNLRKCTVSELRDHFSKYGRLLSCNVYDENTAKRHARIQFESVNQAKAAFEDGVVNGNQSKHSIGNHTIFLRFDSGRSRKYMVICIIFSVLLESPHSCLFSGDSESLQWITVKSSKPLVGKGQNCRWYGILLKFDSGWNSKYEVLNNTCAMFLPPILCWFCVVFNE